MAGDQWPYPCDIAAAFFSHLGLARVSIALKAYFLVWRLRDLCRQLCRNIDCRYSRLRGTTVSGDFFVVITITHVFIDLDMVAVLFLGLVVLVVFDTNTVDVFSHMIEAVPDRSRRTVKLESMQPQCAIDSIGVHQAVTLQIPSVLQRHGQESIMAHHPPPMLYTVLFLVPRHSQHNGIRHGLLRRRPSCGLQP